jgi:hypothetical protein
VFFDDGGRRAAPCSRRTCISIPVTLFFRFSGQVQKRTPPLDNAGLALLRLRCTNEARNGGQLQHGRMLAFAQVG